MALSNTLPSTKWLQSFLSVARCGSFTLAAEELHLTQSAISKQIHSLEEQLGQSLFIRQHNQLSLTPIGQQYLPKITEALELIQQASASIIQSSAERHMLTLDVSPSFASLWLIKALTTFENKCTQLKILTGDNLITQGGVIQHDADIVIRCLPLSDHYSYGELLTPETLTLVASTTQISHNEMETTEDLTKIPWLPQTTRPNQWLKLKKEYSIQNKETYASIGFEHFYLAVSALHQQPSLALLPTFMAKELLHNGTLFNPQHIKIVSGYGYYLFSTHRKRRTPHILTQIEWLQAALKIEV